jgi:hypothetical protein
MPLSGLSGDELLFMHDDEDASKKRQAAAEQVIKEEEWKREFRQRLLDAIPRFNAQKMLNRTRLHCAEFKIFVSQNEAYSSEVGKLTATALQLLAVSSSAVQLQKDAEFFRATYVNLFVTREELRGHINNIVEKKLLSTRGAGGEFYQKYMDARARMFSACILPLSRMLQYIPAANPVFCQELAHLLYSLYQLYFPERKWKGHRHQRAQHPSWRTHLRYPPP